MLGRSVMGMGTCSARPAPRTSGGWCRVVPAGPQLRGSGPLRPRAVPAPRVGGAAGAGEAGVDGAGAVDGAAGQVVGVEGGDREHVLTMPGRSCISTTHHLQMA